VQSFGNGKFYYAIIVSMNIKQKADQIIASGDSKKEKILKLCELVREIPYKRIGSFNPDDMAREGKGSCTPKHVFLAGYLQKLGVPFRFLIMPFYYKKMPLAYPTDKRSIVENMPVSYHVALKAKIDGEWRIIDVTWDSRLKELGFPVNEKWNGESDMKLGVIPEEITEKEVDPRKFEKDKAMKYTEQEKVARKEFYNLLDEVIDQVRN